MIENNKKNITILSLDYDGCGDLLFEGALEHGCFKHRCDILHAEYLLKFNHVLQGARQALNNVLSHETTGADVVELCVGSTRQTRSLDRLNHSRNNNGLCFENYADLAEKNKWHFNRMLFADFVDASGELRDPPLEPGQSMGVLNKDIFGKYKYSPDAFSDNIQAFGMDEHKTVLLSLQIKAILKKYPNDNIKFVFIDDRMDILDQLKTYFSLDSEDKLGHIQLKLIRTTCGEEDSLCDYARTQTTMPKIVRLEQRKIVCVATLDKTTKQAQNLSISHGLFSQSRQGNASMTENEFMYKLLGFISICLVILIMANSLPKNNHYEHEHEHEHDVIPSF